jgi:predicted RecB family nuclease
MKENDFERAPQSVFMEMLAEMGLKHEARHAEIDLPGHLDLGGLKIEEQARMTLEAIAKGDRVIYQGAFVCETEMNGRNVEVVGLPDFLIPEGDSHVIRDAKLARSIGSNRVDIQRQLQIYGWLYQEVTGSSPTRLEVYTGKRELEEIPLDDGAALSELQSILDFKLASEEPFEPVGYSKCQGCPYREHCWPKAVAEKAPGVIPAIDVALGRVLNDQGISTYTQVEQLGLDSLAAITKPHGTSEQRFGEKRARDALRQIEAFESGREVPIGPIRLPENDHFVMFDVEDLPPDTDGPDKVYLWGLQPYAASGEAGPFKACLAGFEEQGDLTGWREFLLEARRMMDEFGEDVPFVHWHHHEITKLKGYATRFPTVEGIDDPVGLVRHLIEVNCLDLFKVVKDAFALPLPSYSLKLVEDFVGYERTKVPGYKGDQSIARYIQAIETNDQVLREKIVGEVCAYNSEDLEATWAVMEWMLNKQAARQEEGR